MAITCALGDKHIKALTSVISKAMLNASEKGEAFDIYSFMNNLYSNLKERQGVDNAIQYMQQVPYIANRIDAKLEIELSKDTNGNEISLKALSKSFRNDESGIDITLSFFEKTISPESLAVIAYDNANKPVEKFEYQEPEVEADVTDFADDRLKARTILSGTHEEFISKNPDEVITETLDKSKLATINAIGRISVAARDMSALDNVRIDGVELKLQAKPLTKIAEEDRTEYSNNMILRQNAIISEGKTSITIPAKEQIALVVVDTNGKPVYFDEQGRVTTKENGGKLVYQMLRNVVQEKGRFTAVNIYGYKNQIISPIKEAELQLRDSGLSKEEFEKEIGMSMAEYVQEIDRQQQEDFKKIYDLKRDIVENNTTRTINLTGASRGVYNLKAEKNIILSKLTSTFPQIAEDIVKTINNLDVPYNNFKSGDTVALINDEVIKIDRSQITKETADKIAAVLTNPKINSTEKLAFYHQFFTDQKITIPTSIQRHDLNYKGTKLVFSYVPYTSKQAELNPSLKKENTQLREIDLNSPTAAKDISDILMSGWSTKAGELARANMVYKTSLIDGTQTYYDYVDGKLIAMGQSAYIDFILNQDGRVMIQGTKAIPLYNAYLKFSLDTSITDQINEAQETVKERQDTRSEVRKFKDDLVSELKADPNLKPSAEVVNVSTTSVSDGTQTSTITVKIDGKEGEHKFYQSTIAPKIGTKLEIGLNPVEIRDGFGFPDNVSLYNISNGNINYYGNLGETDFNAKEPSRAAVPMQQQYVAEQMEAEALAEVTVAPKTVTEEESDVQVSEGINPSNTQNPGDSSSISDLLKSFKLDRNTSLPKEVTAEQVENALDWYNNSPLKKYLGDLHMINIVNSDAYARFVTAGSTLMARQFTSQLGQIQINKATGGSIVDTYHEAWHAFSQLFLTRKEKIDLYNELKKSNPKYKNYSFLELEELLAEDFRSYALNQKTKPSSPKRNSLFRRMLNFLKEFFGGETSITDNLKPYDVESEGVAGDLFRNLYLASSNPNLLNIYTPSIDNVMWDILNRGIVQVGNKNEPALNDKDANVVNESLDSVISDIVDESFEVNKTKTGTTKIITDKNNREVAYQIAKLKFEERLKALRGKLTITPENPFASFETLKNLEDNASAIIRSSKGDDKYIFLKSQVEDFDNLSLATKKGKRIKGEFYKDTVEIIGDFYTHDAIKNKAGRPVSVIIVDTIEEAKAQYDSYKDAGATSFESFEINPEVNASSSYEIKLTDSKRLDAIRILQTAIRNWDSVVKYHTESSSYEILKKEVEVEAINNETEDSADPTNTEKIKGDIGKETLFELGGKDVIYILRSLHKKSKQVGGEYVNEFNELGFKKPVNFRQIWNTIVKVTNSAKSPEEIYKRIVDASNNFPELKQLVDFKLPNPSEENSSYEFDITTSFWSVFSLPRVPYLQLSVFNTEDGMSTEVTSGSLDTRKIVNTFRTNFKTNRDNPFVTVADSNAVFLDLQKVVDSFSNKLGQLDDTKNKEFLGALGIKLENTEGINSAISNLGNRTYYGLPYLFDIVKDLNTLNRKGNKTEAEKKLLISFKTDPLKTLSDGIPAKMIGAPTSKTYKEGTKQKTQIDRIAELQIRYGFGVTSMSSSNAEGNRVNEHTTDNSLTVIADAMNTAENRTDMYAEGNPLRFLDPRNNPMAESSYVIKNLFEANNMKAKGKRINTFLVSGTQRTDLASNDGQNTTSLSQQGKLLQEIHTMLKSGIQEVMRAGSKSSAWGWALEGGMQLGVGKSNEPYLYADIDSFVPQTGKERLVIERIILPYLSGETKRINVYKTNPEAKNYIGYNRKANPSGEAFGEIYNYFDKVLTNDTKAEILEKVKDPNVSLLDYLETDQTLKDKIVREIAGYFNRGSKEIYDQVSEASFFDHKLLNKLSQLNASIEQKEQILTKAYFYNAWIHNMETSILFFTGDIAQLDHSKEAGHKRTSGLISNGPRIRTDIAAQIFINDRNEGGFSNSTYARTLGKGYDNFVYNGYLNTAVIEDIARDSIYMDKIRKGLTKDLKKRNPNMPDAEVSKIVERDVEKYSVKKITEGDGQGYITFDAYRALKKLQNKWSKEQEALYQKIVKGEDIPLGTITEFFPVYKLQNFGFVEGTVLPVSAMHKFALLPLIPNVIQGTELENLHKQMLKNNVQYLTFASGSKIGGVTANGKPDQIFEEGSKKIKPNLNFTKNTIHGAYIKEAASVPSKSKGKVIFSTQLRKLILEGLYENGGPVSDTARELTSRYERLIDFYSELVRKELENEIGYTKDESGTYIGKPDKFLKLIQQNLKQKDYPEHLINSLKVNDDGTLNYDLSYFIDSEGIETIVMSILNKRLVKQKINGEALVQVASSMWNGTWDMGQAAKFSNLSGEELEAIRKKYLGTNGLPFYDTETVDLDAKYKGLSKDELKSKLNSMKRVKTENFTPTNKYIFTVERDYLEAVVNGKKPEITTFEKPTSAMKVAISLQGDFLNLLKLNHIDGQPIKTRERLNEMIKNEEWLEKDNNRKSITLNAVRIPVQGLNSMEFMEVYEFLDPSAGSIIILPTEIVAKSGGDYDVDKLTTFFPNIDANGNYVTSEISNEEFFDKIKDVKDPTQLIKLQKKAVQNQMIDAIKSILEIEENYAALVKPNDTYILKDVADELQEFVSKRDKFAKNNGDPSNISAKNNKMISPTSMLEPLYNNGKHSANMEGKGVLGIIANDNALHPLLTSIGYLMPKKYKASEWDKNLNRYREFGEPKYDFRIFLPHNIRDGRISLSAINSKDGINKIADIFSQAVNGSVDVEADEWIFYIQGNLEVASVLFYLIKAGVPVKDAIYFVSNPLVREYAERQRLANGVFSGPTGTASKGPSFVQYDSAKYVFDKYAKDFIKNRLSGVSDTENISVERIIYVEENGRYKKTLLNEKYNKADLLNALPEIVDSIQKIKVEKGLAYEKLRPSQLGVYETSNFLSKIPGTMVDGKFSRQEMLNTIKNKGTLTPDQLTKSLAILAHFVEIQKQIKGLAALKREAKPDVNADRTPQQAVMRELNQDLLENNSKVDQESADRLFNDSVVSSFGEREIIKDIFMPMMELIDGDKVTKYLSESIGGKRINQISQAFGTGTESTITFTKKFKIAIKSFIFQNYLSNMIDKNGNIVSVPTEYRKSPVRINNNLNSDVEIQNGQYIVNESRIKRDYIQKAYLATSESAESYSNREGLSAFELSNDMFPTEESYFKYVLEREHLYQKGLRGDELNQIALMNVFNYAALMLPGKYSYSDLVLRILNKHRKTLSTNYSIVDQIAKVVDKPAFSILTLSDRDTLTGEDNSRYATELKALANPRIQKVGNPEENMMISRMFRLFPLIMTYQHGAGKTRYGFDLALPVDDYLSVMKSAGELFKQNYQTDKTYDIILKRLTGIAAKDDPFADNLTGPKESIKNYLTSAKEYNSTFKTAKAEEVTEPVLGPEEEAEYIPTTQPTQAPISAKVEVEPNYYTSELLKANPDKIYVFGDNNQRQGKKGQAAIRDEANAMGISTKLRPSADEDAFMTDKELADNKAVIDSDIYKIKATGKTIVFPKDGLGTGLAALKTKAPQTYAYLKQRLLEEFGFNNDTGTITTQPTTQPVGEIKEGVSELFESKPELANVGTPQQYSEWINYLTTQGKLAGTNSTEILYHGSDSKLEKFSNVGAGTHFGTLKSAKERRNKAIIPVILNINNPVLFKDILADDVLKAADEFLKENGEYLEYGYRNEESGLLVYLHKQGKIDSDTLWDALYTDRNTMMQILQNALGSNGYRYINEVEDKGSTSYVVFEPEQIYILGSKQDIEGFKNFVSTQPTQAPTTAPVNYNEVPKVQVQPKLEPGRYVTFDNKTWIVTKQNENGTWQIYNPLLEGANAKKSVAEKNLGIRSEIAKVVNYRGQDYLVTPNNTIISLVSNKKMNWANNDGNRIGIIQLAKQGISPTQETIPNAPAGEVAGNYQFSFANGHTITTPFRLNDQQQAALLELEKFVDNPSEFDNEIALIGYAGTGKTTIISLFDNYLQSRGKMPMYSAPTHRANSVTRFNNPKAKVVTLHKAFGISPEVNLEDGQMSVENLESKQTNEPDLRFGSILIIDESSMITDQLYEFIERYKKSFDLKVIYLGDPAQLAPVDPKKKETAVSAALERPTKVELTKVERTNDNPILVESTNLREGRPLSGVSDELNGRGVEYVNNPARLNQIIGQALQEMQSSQDFLHFRILSAKNQNLKSLNDLSRKALYGVDESTQLVVGDIMMGYDNFASDGKGGYKLANSGDYEVVTVKGERKTLKTSQGNIVFEGYTVGLKSLLDPNETPFTIFVAKKGSVNAQASEKFIEAISGLLRAAKMADGLQRRQLFGMMFKLQSEIAFMEPQYNRAGYVAIKKSLDYGYAHTIHKSQGGTYNKVLVLADTIDNSRFDSVVKQQLRYVAVSRARDYVYISSNSSEVAQDTGEFTPVDRSGNDVVKTTLSVSDIAPVKTVASKTSADMPMSDENIAKIFNGTRKITNRTAKFANGIYTVGNLQQIEVRYLGKAVVVGNSVVVTNEEKNTSFVRSKDDFAKAEGFKNWSEFERNNPTATNFIKGTQGRFIYEVKPAGNISAETGAGQSIDPAYNSVIKAFNDKLIASNGVLPKEFIHQEGNVPQKYLLTKNNLYNLVDIDTGSIYLRNINLQTGEIVNEDLPSVAVDKQRVKSFIDRVNKDIKNFKVDVVLAEKNVDVQDILDAAENANTENDLDAVISKYNKNIC